MGARISLLYSPNAVGCGLQQSFKKLVYLGPVLKEYCRIFVLYLALLCLYVRCSLERGAIVMLVIRDGWLTLVVPLLRRSHSRSPMSNRRRHIGSRVSVSSASADLCTTKKNSVSKTLECSAS